MPSDRPSARSPINDEVLEAGEVTYDLRQPPTRDEVGLFEDRDTVSIQHLGSTPTIDVTVVLPEDVTVRFDTGLIGITTLDLGERAGQPESLDLRRSMTLDEANAELDRAIEVLGLDALDVDQWRDEAERVTNSDELHYGTTVFKGRRLGGVEPTVEVALRDSGRIGFHYNFRWHLDVDAFGDITPTSSTEPSS